MEEIISQLIEASPILGAMILLLLLLGWGIAHFVKYLDKKNMDITNTLFKSQEKHIEELKTNINKLEKKNEADGQMFREGFNVFTETAKTFKQVAEDLSTVKEEIGDMKKDILEIKIKQDLK